MSCGEKILLHYLRALAYQNDPTNQVGTDADHESIFPGIASNRTVPTPTGDIAYVRKFGTQVSITNCTACADPPANTTAKIYAADGTLLGSRVSGGGFVSSGLGPVTAQGAYIEFVATGASTILAVFNIVFAEGAIVFNFPTETMGGGETLRYYLSNTTSTYYDAAMRYGGKRHTPDPALNNADLPYFDIATAYAALAAANNDGVEILDSATYDEDLTTDNQALDSSNSIVYSSAGQSPTITRGIGARVTREVSTQYNNLTAIYFNENGDDADAGTWQEPKLTIAGAIAARVAHQIVYGGTGATILGGKFNESVTIAAAYTLESDYGYMPTIYSNAVINQNVNLTHASANIYGFIIDGNLASVNGIKIGADPWSGNIKNNTVFNTTGVSPVCIGSDWGGAPSAINGTISYNHVYNSTYGINAWVDAGASGSIHHNIISNCTPCINLTVDTGNSSFGINNNIMYDGAIGVLQVQIVAGGGNTYSGIIENNTIYNSTIGFNHIYTSGTDSGTYRDMIVYGGSSFDLRAVGSSPTITESNYGTNSGFTIGAGNITTDPKFCKTTLFYKLGISADSGAYRADTSSDDMGAHLRIIEIDAADIEINGIKFDSQEQFNVAIFIRDTANHTGLNVKWCNIFDFQGIDIDLYDDGTDLDAIISNNLISNNGNGLKLAYGGNTVEENVFFNNTIFGIHSDYTGTTFNHNVFYLNQYGVHLESNSGAIIIKNSIFNQNSLYGIYSEVAIIVTYCCIKDGAVNSNVDITDDTNTNDNPLLVNTEENEENFNIKTIERGDLLDSPCKDTGESSSDIGAYTITRSTLSDIFKKYELAYNPLELNPAINPKGLIDQEGVRGGNYLYAKEHKRLFPLNWGSSQLSSEALRLTMALMNKLIQTRKNQYSKEQTRIRFHQRPDTFLETGTSATVDATEKTILDSTKSWIQDQWEGYWVGIKFTSGTSDGDIVKAAKTLTVTGAGWTVDEWIGYFVYNNGYYYIVVSNTDEVLTLGDPDATLTNQSSITWAIEKYFEIKFNTDTTLTVYDEDDELVAGSLDYYIDFIVVKVKESKFLPKAIGLYDYENDEYKTGYSLILEQE